MATLKPQSNGPLCSNTVIGTLGVAGWGVTFDTARRGLGALGARPVPFSLVPNVAAHPATPSVPTSYYLMWHYNCLWNLMVNNALYSRVISPCYRQIRMQSSIKLTSSEI